jgi:hypothetical protein
MGLAGTLALPGKQQPLFSYADGKLKLTVPSVAFHDIVVIQESN